MAEPRASKNKILIFVCTVMFLDTLGFGLILPIIPALIDEMSTLTNSAGATVAGYLLLTFAAMQFVFAPVLGGLSDRYGRRPILLLALFGFAVNYFIMAAAPTLAFLFLARFISGICGATFAAANACIADISDQDERAKFFGLTGAAVGLGFVFGPVFGGALGEIGTRIPFIVAGILTAGLLLYGMIFLPETLKAENQRPFSFQRANPIGSLVAVAKHPIVFLVLMAVFCFQLSNQSFSSIWPFYVIELTGWSELWIGLTVGFYGVLTAIVQGILVGPVTTRFGEVRAVYFSIAVGLISFIILAFAATGKDIYLGILIGSLSGFAFPCMQAMMTARTPETEQGELQGAIMCLYSLSAIIGPVVMAWIFSAHTDGSGLHLPGAPFIAAAGLIVFSTCAFWAAVRLISRQRHQAPQGSTPQPQRSTPPEP